MKRTKIKADSRVRLREEKAGMTNRLTFLKMRVVSGALSLVLTAATSAPAWSSNCYPFENFPAPESATATYGDVAPLLFPGTDLGTGMSLAKIYKWLQPIKFGVRGISKEDEKIIAALLSAKERYERNFGLMGDITVIPDIAGNLYQNNRGVNVIILVNNGHPNFNNELEDLIKYYLGPNLNDLGAAKLSVLKQARVFAQTIINGRGSIERGLIIVNPYIDPESPVSLEQAFYDAMVSIIAPSLSDVRVANALSLFRPDERDKDMTLRQIVWSLYCTSAKPGQSPLVLQEILGR